MSGVMMTGAAVAAGGFLGGVLRFAATAWLTSRRGVLVANVVASALLGAVVAGVRDPLLVALVGTGLAGALSTWSTLAKEVGLLVVAGRRGWAVGYLVATLLLGITAAAVAAALV